MLQLKKTMNEVVFFNRYNGNSSCKNLKNYTSHRSFAVLTHTSGGAVVSILRFK